MTNIIADYITSIISIIVAIAVIIATYKMFQKANDKGWKAIIPFYNSYTEYKLAWNTDAFWVTLASTTTAAILMVATKFMTPGLTTLIFALIALAALIITLVMTITKDMKLAAAFGHGKGFGLGLIFLELIFRMILSFGKSEYTRA